MANFRGGWTPPRHSGTWVGARVASLRCHYPPPRRSQYSRNAKARPHKSKTSCRGGHRRGTTTSGPGRGPLAGFEVTLYGRFWGDRRGQEVGTAPWLKLKRMRRISDLPLQIPAAPTDRIGAFYNHIRKRTYEFFADMRPLENSRGAVCGGRGATCVSFDYGLAPPIQSLVVSMRWNSSPAR
jgi:hypothetical protein